MSVMLLCNSCRSGSMRPTYGAERSTKTSIVGMQTSDGNYDPKCRPVRTEVCSVQTHPSGGVATAASSFGTKFQVVFSTVASGPTTPSMVLPLFFNACRCSVHTNRKGKLRSRWPVRANSALATAGAMGGTPGSPTPSGWAVLGMMSVCITGHSLKRNTGWSL